MKKLTLWAMALLLLWPSFAKASYVPEKELQAYLFAYFVGKQADAEAVRLAVSLDGYHYLALNDGKPVLDSRIISSTGGVRDPHIYRGHDGKTFYMVLTDMRAANGWDSNRAMVLLRSTDLVNWQHSVVNIQKRFEGQDNLKRVWAPQTIYDEKAGKYLIYWSMQHGKGPDIIYYAYANKEFTDIEGEPKPFFLPQDGKACIDGDIVVKDGTYYLFYKTEGHGDGIRVATTTDLTSGQWTESPDYKQQTDQSVEGAGTFKLIGQDKYILMYDVYRNGKYQFTESTDLKHFRVIDHEVTMDFHPRHGTVMAITRPELLRLLARWGKPAGLNLDIPVQTATVSGPDGKLQLTVSCPEGGKPTYEVSYDGQPMLLPSPLGLETNIGDFALGLTMTSHQTQAISERYEQSRIKQSVVSYEANELTCQFANADGRPLEITFRVSRNDIALRYTLPKKGETGSVRILAEATGFRFPDGTTTFLSPQSDPMIGWKRTKPSYEEEYTADAPMDTPSQYGRGYTFPCLFRVNQQGWVLLSETGVDSRYCGSHLSDYTDGCYTIAFPMEEENNGNGTVAPAFALPGNTPWRTLSIGSDLKPIVETTVPWDVVTPRYETKQQYRFGRGTWSWILWQDDSINYDDQVKFIDLASAMGYEYALVDCAWDTNIGRERVADLVRYARSKKVELFLWYSSSGYWNDITQSPINHMDNSIIRKREMAWLQSLGVKGIKVDFFGGDKQETMRLYEEILSDADDHGLMVIFHGCTLPRGWERMYPNYVGSEAVLASENLIFQQHFCDVEAFNATLHPFIRNAVGCMEYGGSFLNKRMHRSNERGNIRRTTDVFSLATAVLFQNPIQNFALAPNNLTDAPALCMDFMRQVPTTWDETRFIEGYPGRYIVLARRHGNQWYVAAINATDQPLKLSLDLTGLFGSTATCLTTGKQQQTESKSLKLSTKKALSLTIQPNDGAVIY